MRLPLYALSGAVLLFGLGVSSDTLAQAPTAPATRTAPGTQAIAPGTEPRPLRQLEPPTRPKEIEKVQRRRPSGFWTSTRPAKGGAYRYRMLGIGVVLMLLTLAGMIWVVRNYTRGDKSTPTTD